MATEIKQKNIESEIPEGWVNTTLGDIALIKGGKRLPKGENLIKSKTDHPYIRITDLENNKIKKHQLEFVTDEVHSSISRYIVNSGDVILSIVGSVGFVAKVDSDLEGANLTENCVKIVNLEGIESHYLYYFLISQLGQDEINKNTVGAVQKKLPIYGVQNIRITLPPIPEQKAIADILSSLDKKIELLRDQNITLEKTARTIFNEWFGKYKVGEELPQGWRTAKYSDLVDLGTGKNVHKRDYIENGAYKIIGANGVLGSYDKFLVDEPVIVTGRVGTLGTVFILNEPAWISDNVLISKPVDLESFYYTYFLLKTFNFNALNSGSTQPLITQSSLNSIEIIIPKLDLLTAFNDFAKNLFNKIFENNNQINVLTITRDTLLPKLMKGEIRVS